MDARTTPYFSFANAKEAVAYYQDVFGATEVYRLSPDQQQAQALNLPPDTNLATSRFWGFKIMDLNFCFSDASGDQPQASGIGHAGYQSDPTAEASFQLISAGRGFTASNREGTVQDAFWGNKMGTVIGKYGCSGF